MIPRDRIGEFHQRTIPPYKRNTDTLENSIIQMYSHGITTREISDLIEKMYGHIQRINIRPVGHICATMSWIVSLLSMLFRRRSRGAFIQPTSLRTSTRILSEGPNEKNSFPTKTHWNAMFVRSAWTTISNSARGYIEDSRSLVVSCWKCSVNYDMVARGLHKLLDTIWEFTDNRIDRITFWDV